MRRGVVLALLLALTSCSERPTAAEQHERVAACRAQGATVFVSSELIASSDGVPLIGGYYLPHRLLLQHVYQTPPRSHRLEANPFCVIVEPLL